MRVFALFDGADRKQIMVGQVVCLSDAVFFIVADFLGELRIASLVQHVDFLVADAVEFHYVLLCLATCSDYAVGLFAGIAELVVVDFTVEVFVQLREFQEDKVVDSNNFHSLCLVDVAGQFITQSVENINSLLFYKFAEMH